MKFKPHELNYLNESALRKALPLVINSFNQYYYIAELVDGALSNGFTNIWIIDQKSDYPPLLNWYLETSRIHGKTVTIVNLPSNLGPHFFHRSGLWTTITETYHLYTDPDIIVERIAPLFLSTLIKISEHYNIGKVGCALRIPDPHQATEATIRMPETDNLPVSISDWESRFWTNEIEAGLFLAPIDTTLALINKRHWSVENYYSAIRVNWDGFVAKHRPWFKDDQPPEEESKHYKATRVNGAWL